MYSNLVFMLVIAFGERFPSSDSEYQFILEKVDNRVEIYFDDSLVYNSGTIESNPDMDLVYKFSDDEVQDKTITLKLINGTEPDDPYQEDKHWEIRYELFKDGEPFDYQWEYGDDYQLGVVYTKQYTINDL